MEGLITFNNCLIIEFNIEIKVKISVATSTLNHLDISQELVCDAVAQFKRRLRAN